MRMASPCATCRFATCKFIKLKKKILAPPPFPKSWGRPELYTRDYITPLGLDFNLSKNTCTTFDTTYQVVNPTCSLNGVKLKQDESVTYLGTRLSNQTRDHIDSRITAVRRAFYGLHDAGLCVGDAHPFTIAHMYKKAIQPILTYGCSTIELKPNVIDELEKVQVSLIKAALGLSKYSRNTPILRQYF